MTVVGDISLFSVESSSENQLCPDTTGWHDMQVNIDWKMLKDRTFYFLSNYTGQFQITQKQVFEKMNRIQIEFSRSLDYSLMEKMEACTQYKYES